MNFGEKLRHFFRISHHITQNKNNILKTQSIRRKVLLAPLLYLCASKSKALTHNELHLYSNLLG